MNRDKLKAQLEIDEGKRSRMYKDQNGNLTIGIGHNLMAGISEGAIQAILDGDIDSAIADLDTHFGWWHDLDDDRQDALLNMAFQLGINRLSDFHDFLAALEAKDFDSASVSMLKSQWAGQCPERAARLAAVIKGPAA